MNSPYMLKAKHKEFLREQGYNPKDFLIVNEDFESYTFYHRRTGQVISIRR